MVTGAETHVLFDLMAGFVKPLSGQAGSRDADPLATISIE